MDEQRVRALFEAVTVESCLKLFHDYNVQVTPAVITSRSGEGMLYCGIVGFTAKGFRGSIVLSATAGPLEHSNPVKASSQRDWMAELANQLAGRMKNRMLPHNVDISVSIPVVLRGEHVFLESRSELHPLVFDAPGGLITVWIDIELLEGFSLSFDRDESQIAVAEGETLMF